MCIYALVLCMRIEWQARHTCIVPRQNSSIQKHVDTYIRTYIHKYIHSRHTYTKAHVEASHVTCNDNFDGLVVQRLEFLCSLHTTHDEHK
jgi:hypothetical protein